MTRKWIEVNYISDSQYSVNENMSFKGPVLGSDSCDYSDGYIFVKGEITVKGTGNANRTKKLTYNKNAPIKSWKSKIYNTFRGNAKDLVIGISMYNFLEYSENYSVVCVIVIEMK